MTITNVQLNESIKSLKEQFEQSSQYMNERVNKLEKRMDESDKCTQELSSSMHTARVVLTLVGAVVGPLITALVVLSIQHIWK